jgi:hypothetical protein
MARITIYLPDEIEARARAAARRQDTSLSRWVAGLVNARLRSEWPDAVLQAFGAFPDFPEGGRITPGLWRGLAKGAGTFTVKAAAPQEVALPSMEEVPFDREAAREAARGPRGAGTPGPSDRTDRRDAGTAMSRVASLVTNNVRDSRE